MRGFLAGVLTLVAGVASAEAVVAVSTIRANTILTAQDIAVNSGMNGVGLTDPNDAIGMETRVVLYAGRPIRAEYLGPPALVQRNQIVPLVYTQSGLTISTAGRALDRGAEGEIIRVMNTSSRSTLFGTVRADGTIDVSGS